MVLAVVTKELRESRMFAALALAAYAVCVCKFTGTWNRSLALLLGWVPGLGGALPDLPFVQDGFGTIWGTVGVALAITLGFRQSAWEPSQGTSLYLLHCPLGRRTIYMAKLLTGLGLLLLCTLLPIVIYATWAATPGSHAAPFEWSMTGPIVHFWLVLPLFYLGAFASGIRPARWFGSRLLPLLSAATLAWLVQVLPRFWVTGFPAALLVGAVFACGILLEAETRDY